MSPAFRGVFEPDAGLPSIHRDGGSFLAPPCFSILSKRAPRRHPSPIRVELRRKEPKDDRSHIKSGRGPQRLAVPFHAGGCILSGLSFPTLEKMRLTGNGPRFRKHGRYVRYHIADLDAWSEGRQKNSTSDAEEGA